MQAYTLNPSGITKFRTIANLYFFTDSVSYIMTWFLYTVPPYPISHAHILQFFIYLHRIDK